MADCSKCKNADRCEAWDIDKVRRTGECEVYKPITNADKIRSMSDEELAEFINFGTPDCSDFCSDFKQGCPFGCKHNHGNDVLLEWLQSEAE